jgi:hypothetical protein
VFTYWPLRPGLSRRITWITALSALLAVFSFVVVKDLAPAPAPLPASSAGTDGSASSSVFALASQHPRQSVEVIVQFTPSTSVRSQRSVVAAEGGQVTRDLHVIHGLGVRLPAAAAVQLAGDPRVLALSLNAAVRSSTLGPT